MAFNFAVVPIPGATRMLAATTTSQSVTLPVIAQTRVFKLYTGDEGLHIQFDTVADTLDARSDGEGALSAGEADHFLAANAVEVIHAPAGMTLLHYTTASGTSACKLVPVIAVGPNAS